MATSNMTTRHNFYPRPPRGGRRSTCCPIGRQNVFLSTPSARRATSRSSFRSRPVAYFYPRPPRGGRPLIAANARPPHRFLSTPSARRATPVVTAIHLSMLISIHALREEGDQINFRFTIFLIISIHALREEGDQHRGGEPHGHGYFYPRPPRGGRRGS